MHIYTNTSFLYQTDMADNTADQACRLFDLRMKRDTTNGNKTSTLIELFDLSNFDSRMKQKDAELIYRDMYDILNNPVVVTYYD